MPIKMGRPPTHGMRGAPEYYVWRSMKTRCANPKVKTFPRYGGRGITVCDRWRASFADFIADMGPRPTAAHQLERVDNEGGYNKANCEWVTRDRQNSNRRDNFKLTYEGRTQTLLQWARETGLNRGTIRDRIRRGLSASDALTIKPQKGRRWSA